MKEKNNRSKTPLLKKLLEYLQKGTVGFHTPGHQQGNGFGEEFCSIIEQYALRMDLTEIPGLDNLRAPSECLEESQILAAKAFGAYKTFFLVNGSTLGLQAALLTVNKPGEKIIIARNSHVSIINGLILSGGMPVLAPVEIEKEWGFPLGVSIDQLKSVWKNNSDAASIVFTNPEYRGTGVDINQAIQLIKSWKIPVIIDEAHGSHLYFQEKAPLSAQCCAPDIVVHSAHKTLASLTQTSLLHINNEKWADPIQSALNVLQTSSPSYLLLASLDSVQAQMSSKGKEIINQVIDIAQSLRWEIGKIGGYRVFEANEKCGWHNDITKVLVSAAGLGLTGWELASILHNKYDIAVEMSDYYYVLLIVHLGHTQMEIKKIIDALISIRKQFKTTPLESLQIPVSQSEQGYQPEVSPREIFFASKEIIPLKQAKGRIVGEPVVFYPPGVPLVWPGEVILQEHIDFIGELQHHKGKVRGNSLNSMVTVLTKG